MATNKINVVEKTPGTHIEYALSGGKKITFGDDELTINLASRERDFEVSLDICIDEEDGVVIGTGGRAQKYAARLLFLPDAMMLSKMERTKTENRKKFQCLSHLICRFAHLFFGDWRYKELCLILMI